MSFEHNFVDCNNDDQYVNAIPGHTINQLSQNDPSWDARRAGHRSPFWDSPGHSKTNRWSRSLRSSNVAQLLWDSPVAERCLGCRCG